MDTSIWSQTESVFSSQFSVFSPMTAAPAEDNRKSAVGALESLRLFIAIQTFQTYVRAIKPDELLIAQLRAESRSRPASGNDHEPYYVRTRCYAPTLGRFLPRDPE